MKLENEVDKKINGSVDLIGMDVLRFEGSFTPEEAEEKVAQILLDEIKMKSRIFQVQGQTYAVQAIFGNLNKVTSLMPEDLDGREAMQVQMNIAELLSEEGMQLSNPDGEEGEEIFEQEDKTIETIEMDVKTQVSPVSPKVAAAIEATVENCEA
jgi:hypothetical protein